MANQSKTAFPKLPASLAAKRRGDVAILSLARPHKRNALDDATVLGIERFFAALPKGIKAVVMHGRGEHFSAGLDLSELTERDVAQGVEHSRMMGVPSIYDVKVRLKVVDKFKDYAQILSYPMPPFEMMTKDGRQAEEYAKIVNDGFVELCQQHGRDGGDRRDPQPGRRTLAGDPRRNRPRNQHLGRIEPRVGDR